MEDVTMMMISSSPENPRNETISTEPITTSTCPTWKLYENPFYYSHHNHSHPYQQQLQQQCQTSNFKSLHCLQLPLSARKLAASFWDLTFFRPIMESELDFARAQIMELKTELEYERKARKKLESMNKRMTKELFEERRGREAVERVCAELAKEISSDKAEISRMKRDMEEERKMLRMSEVLREERVQMKLAEAKILFEEKLLELEGSIRFQSQNFNFSPSKTTEQSTEEVMFPSGSFTCKAAGGFSGKFRNLELGEKSSCNDSDGVDSGESRGSVLIEKSAFGSDINDLVSKVSTRPSVLCEKPACNDNNGGVSSTVIQKKASPEPENPHIKRGIKGFVEFPKVVRAIGSKSRHWGTKLECQRAQLRILLKQKSPIRSNSLIMS